MRFLVVLFALVAVAVVAPAPSAAAGSGTAKKRSIGHVSGYAVPSTVSQYSGVNPLVAAAPVEYAVVSEPVAARTFAVGPAVYGAHQSRVNLYHSPAVVTNYASPVLSQQVVSSPVLPQQVVSSPVLSQQVVSSPVLSQQVVSSPVFSQQVVSSPAVVDARSVYSPVAAVYSVPSAVPQQSRVDLHSSPALVSQNLVSPAVYSPSSVYSSYW